MGGVAWRGIGLHGVVWHSVVWYGVAWGLESNGVEGNGVEARSGGVTSLSGSSAPQVFPESVSEGFSLSALTAGEKLRHRWECVPAVYLRLFALLRRSGAHPAARIPMLRTDFGLSRSQLTKFTE